MYSFSILFACSSVFTCGIVLEETETHPWSCRRNQRSWISAAAMRPATNRERKTLVKSYWEPCWKRKGGKKSRIGEEWRQEKQETNVGEIIKNTNMKSNSFQFATVQRAKHYEEIGCQACFQVRRAKWKPPKLCACSKTETSKLNVPASFLNPCKRTVLLHTRTQTWPTQRYN